MNKIHKKIKTNDVSFLFSAPNGVAGDITRVDESSVEPAQLVGVGSNPVVYPVYGQPMQYVSGGIQQFNTGSETAASFAGVLVREAPSQGNNLTDDQTFAPNVPFNKVPQGLLVRGYVSVVCKFGTPARGGVVYIQVTAHSGAVPGDFRADGTDSGNAVALSATQAEWAVDGKDANNNAELRVAR